jgi:hypothetical protein
MADTQQLIQALVDQKLANQFPERNATDSERAFFQSSPNVAGYAAPDQAVVLNPFSTLPQESQQAVLRNERYRHAMGLMPSVPPFYPVNHQESAVAGSAYSQGGRNMDETGWARLLSGDASMAPYTMRQEEEANKLLEAMMGRQK